jgi:DNA-binding CsgD family transcriptional regulator
MRRGNTETAATVLSLELVRLGEAGAQPKSETRISPRILAGRAPHIPVPRSTRLSCAALLAGKLGILDMERRGTELRGIFQVRQRPFTEREREVMTLLLRGASEPEIGRRFNITRQCVSGHATNALAKMGIPSKFLALQAWACLKEVERTKGLATFAELEVSGEELVSIRSPIPMRLDLESKMSAAETHVAWLTCDGLSNREIAEIRGSSERTVANQIGSLFQKLGIARRTELAMLLLGL